MQNPHHPGRVFEMKIAIISDTHDNLATLQKAIEWINKNRIEEIIHCGDICSPYTLEELSKMFSGKIHVVFGNVDGDIFTISQQKAAGELPNVILYGEIGELEINNKKIAFVHHPKIAKALALSGQYDLVFHGHTHQPWEENIRTASPRSPNLVFSPPTGGSKINNCRLINPGNLSNMLYKATFAVYNTETDELELKILEQL